MHGISHWIVYSVGFAAQLFFAGRTLFQWLNSERSHKVTSPSAYWGLSIIGASLMFIYGIMRDDFPIILGQFITYFIFLWNLEVKGVWGLLSKVLRSILLLIPIMAVFFLLQDVGTFVANMFKNKEIPLWLVLFGSAGQVLFTLRFVYQWLYSRRRHESILPCGFWVISLIGSGVIIAYGIIRKDPVLILGQSFGFVVYIRNLMIGLYNEKEDEDAGD